MIFCVLLDHNPIPLNFSKVVGLYFSWVLVVVEREGVVYPVGLSGVAVEKEEGKGEKEFAFLALQLAFSLVFLALLTVTAFDFSQLRHASRFFVAKNTFEDNALDPWIPALEQGGGKESKALKLIKASNNGRRKAYKSKRAIAYMELCKTYNVKTMIQTSPNYKAKIKTQTPSEEVFIFAMFRVANAPHAKSVLQILHFSAFVLPDTCGNFNKGQVRMESYSTKKKSRFQISVVNIETEIIGDIGRDITEILISDLAPMMTINDGDRGGASSDKDGGGDGGGSGDRMAPTNE
nr:hypothetical protein [Tanacetum cinerariifolium]